MGLYQPGGRIFHTSALILALREFLTRYLVFEELQNGGDNVT
jgi:hypothetical protein